MLAIYAPLVRDTAISFELQPPTEAQMRERVGGVLERMPWLVCEEDGRVLGYACATPFRTRPAYQWTVEVTVYVHPAHSRRGIARALETALLAGLRLQGFRTALAVIALPNPASVALHEDLGFTPVGVFRAAGYKLGRWHDVGWWELALGDRTLGPKPPRELAALTALPAWQTALEKCAALVRDLPAP
jgi:L-amino acid N-acyltransferase YncA